LQFLPAGSQLNEKQDELEKYKEKYEQYKCSVSVKLKLLDENQVCFNSGKFSMRKIFFFF
jgi:hypothetical protein